MKKKEQPQGLNFSGSLRKAGITIYQKQGKTIIRKSTSYHKKSFTFRQFVQRQRMRHTMALWRTFQNCESMFTEHKTTFLGFASFANRLPVVFVNKQDSYSHPSFLMPDIPVSEGTMTPIKQQLGEVNGVAALITDLKADRIRPYDTFWFYTAEQCFKDNRPKVEFTMKKIKAYEMTRTEAGLALVGEEFADNNKGWALVYVRKDRCSSQCILTRCTYYQQFTSKELGEETAHSYGKLESESYLSPRGW